MSKEDERFEEVMRSIHSGILPAQVEVSGNLMLSQLVTPDDVVDAVNKIQYKQRKNKELTLGEMLLISCFHTASTAFFEELDREKPGTISPTGEVDAGNIIGDQETLVIANDTKQILQDFILTVHGKWGRSNQ